MSLMAGLGWLQLGFAIAGFLFGLGVTEFTFLSPILVGAAFLLVFVLGNTVVVPFYFFAHFILGGGTRAICFAMSLGSPAFCSLRARCSMSP